MTPAYGRTRSWKPLDASLVGLALFTVPLLANSSQASLGITVQVYNSASVPAEILTGAEGEAARIFRDSGVAVSWLNCARSIPEAEANPICVEPCPLSRLAVRITSEMPNRLATKSLGVAFGEIYVTIYYQRVDEYAKRGIATHSQILGDAIAHEMGHLLLGSVPHARFGIMRGEWTAEDLRSISMGALLFKPYQSVLIRNAVMSRTCRHTGTPIRR